MITILSDLHLGIGDEREDFLHWGKSESGPAAQARLRASAQMDETFAKFLARQLTLADQSGITPVLLLLGDTFDFWQARRKRQKPTDTLTDILSVHVEFVVAIRKWISAGGEVNIVIGNHDHALTEENTWNTLAEIFPGLNRSGGGKPAHSWSDEASGLYAEHGHNWDPWNRIRNLDCWNANPAGRMIVEEIINRLEPEFPVIDKLTSLRDVLHYIERNLEPARRRFIWQHLRRLLRTRSLLVQFLEPWAKGGRAPLEKIQEREVSIMNNGIERALRPKPGGTTGKLPSNLRFFASGHTHEPLRVTTRTGVERFNPGTWTPIAEYQNDRITMMQNLPYATISPTDEPGWELKLGSFEKDMKRERRL